MGHNRIMAGGGLAALGNQNVEADIRSCAESLRFPTCEIVRMGTSIEID
jgi:hypothetical protein